MLLKPESSNPLINGKEGISAQRHVEGKWVGTRRNIAFFLILPKSGWLCLFRCLYYELNCCVTLNRSTALGFTLPTIGWDLQGTSPARK